MRLVVGSLALALSVGCGPSEQACLDYVDTYEICAQEARDAGLEVDSDTSDPKGFCEQMDFTDEKWDCLSRAYGQGDCTTEEGLAAILAEAEAC